MEVFIGMAFGFSLGFLVGAFIVACCYDERWFQIFKTQEKD